MSFKAFIFDLDGTLIDSKLDFVKMRSDLGISPGTPILEEIKTWSKEKQAWAHAILDRHEIEGVHASDLYPGVSDFLKFLSEQNIPSALFTRNSRKAAELAIQKHGLTFSVVITRDDHPPKPDPAGLLHIARTLQLSHEDILFVGDYLYDLKAGRAAGIATALFLQAAAAFDTEGAHFLFREFIELHPHCIGFNSPK